MNKSTFRTTKYMNGSVFFSKAMYTNVVVFEILARTPVPQLPPSYPHESGSVRRVSALLLEFSAFQN